MTKKESRSTISALFKYTGALPKTLDDKGRFILPIDFTGDKAAPIEFLFIADKSKKIITAFNTATLQTIEPEQIRTIAPHSWIATADKQDRITIPKQIQDTLITENNQDIVLVGRGEYFEIWKKEDWAKENDDIEAARQAILAQFSQDIP